MSLYSISLFLHIVGALGLFAMLGLEWACLYLPGLAAAIPAWGDDRRPARMARSEP